MLAPDRPIQLPLIPPGNTPIWPHKQRHKWAAVHVAWKRNVHDLTLCPVPVCHLPCRLNRMFEVFWSVVVFVSQPCSCIEKWHSPFFVTPISFLCAHDRGGRTQIFRHKVSSSTTYKDSTKMALIEGLLLFDSVPSTYHPSLPHISQGLCDN